MDCIKLKAAEFKAGKCTCAYILTYLINKLCIHVLNMKSALIIVYHASIMLDAFTCLYYTQIYMLVQLLQAYSTAYGI